MVLPYQSSDPIAHLSLIEEIWVVKWRLLISCHLPYVTFKDLAISCTDKTKKAQNKVSLHLGKTVSTFVVFSSYLAEWPIRSLIGRRPVMCSLFYSLRQTLSLPLWMKYVLSPRVGGGQWALSLIRMGHTTWNITVASWGERKVS